YRGPPAADWRQRARAPAGQIVYLCREATIVGQIAESDASLEAEARQRQRQPLERARRADGDSDTFERRPNGFWIRARIGRGRPPEISVAECPRGLAQR